MPRLTVDGIEVKVRMCSKAAWALTTIAALALGFATSLATPARADSAKTEAANRKTMHDYATCVVKKRRDRASAAILSDSDNTDILHKFPDLIDSECLGRVAGDVQMKFGGDLYRYAMADALVNSAFVSRVDTSFDDRLPLAHLTVPERSVIDTRLAKTSGKHKRDDIEDDYKKRTVIAWMSRYGECIVRHNPIKARLWLLTPPGGPEEVSRINDLRPSFSACLGDGTLKFNRIVMRGTLAINYYRLAMATPVVGKTR